MQLGFIGFGEVAYELATGFRQEGLSGIVAYDPMRDDATLGSLVGERAAKSRVTLLDSAADVSERSEVVIAAVPGSKAVAAAEQAVRRLGRGKIYADVSTSSPTAKKTISVSVEASGAQFVDGALMGALTLLRHKVPTLISGSGSDRFLMLMSPLGMALEKVSDVPGDAVAVKLVRSIYMKGIASLAVEMLQAASVLGVAPRVIDSISATMDGKPFAEMMNFLVVAGGIHAERQAHEMRDVMAMMAELEVDSSMTKGTLGWLEWLASKKLKEKFQGQKPETWEHLEIF
jgi:3-hydroxyisobutyrate dehydrogenase-like beta-hydroxyacid dehydrogenase